jgi:hypothetical protein
MQVVELGQDNQRLKNAAEKASCCWFALNCVFPIILERCTEYNLTSSHCAWQVGWCGLRLTVVGFDAQASTSAEDKVKQIQECNKQAVKENCRCGDCQLQRATLYTKHKRCLCVLNSLQLRGLLCCCVCSLKTKLGQAVTVLRMYHHKVSTADQQQASC